MFHDHSEFDMVAFFKVKIGLFALIASIPFDLEHPTLITMIAVRLKLRITLPSEIREGCFKWIIGCLLIFLGNITLRHSCIFFPADLILFYL